MSMSIREEELNKLRRESQPKSCICPIGEWAPPIGAVCEKFTPDEYDQCKICQHDKGCHIPTTKTDLF